MPDIEMLNEEDNVREGFVDPGEFAALAAELPDHVRPIAQVAFITGWRVGELLSRRWHHVDLDAGLLRLEAGASKNGKARIYPFDQAPELRAVLEAQYERKKAVERQTGRIIDALFFTDAGKPIRSFRGAWQGACVRVGLGRWLDPENRRLYRGLLFHDLRRSAVRNMLKGGVERHAAMKLIGHKTPSILDRYTIVDEEWLSDEAGKVDGVVSAKPKRKVRGL